MSAHLDKYYWSTYKLKLNAVNIDYFWYFLLNELLGQGEHQVACYVDDIFPLF
jgi:hypothetical protein